MRNSSIMVLVFCCVIMFFSCNESDNMATVKIDLSANASILPQQKQPDTIIDRVLRFFSTPAYAAPAGVVRFIVTATGKDMIPVVKVFDPSVLVATLAVPEGSNRLILVKAYNNMGRVIYAGKNVVDLKAGEIKFILISMRSTLRQIADINSGTGDSSPSGFTLCSKKVYFSADDGVNGRELWVYDPLTDAVEMVEDIYPGVNAVSGFPNESNPTNLTAFQGKLYFSANNGVTGVELFCYDPGTGLVTNTANIYSDGGGPQGSYPANLKVMGNKLYFSAASDTDYGPELYIYDGVNPVESVILIPYPTSMMGSNPSDFIKLDNTVFVAGNDGYGVYHFFILNPDTNAVILDVPIYPYVPSSITFFNDTIYFKDDNGALYYVSGSVAVELNIIGGTNFSSVKDMAVQDNFLFIFQDDTTSTLSELWGYNGVVPAVNNVNIRQVYDFTAEGIYDAEFLTPINHILYFKALYPYPSSDSYLFAYIPLLGTPPIPIMQTEVGEDSIRKLGTTAVTFTDGGEAADIWVLDPSSALSTGLFPAPARLPLDGTQTVYTADTAVIGNYLFISGGYADGRELWVYEHYDPLD